MEVLLVMLITSILVLGINGAYRQAGQLWSRVETPRHLYHASTNVIDCLRMDLSGLYMPPIDEGQESFVLSARGDGSLELAFYTLSPSWRTGRTSVRSAMIQYRFTSDQATGESLLERLESPCSGETVIADPLVDVIAEGQFDLQLWAAEPDAADLEQALKSSYSSRESPPEALKILLEWPGTSDTSAVTFEAVVEIPCETQLQQDASEQGQRGNG